MKDKSWWAKIDTHVLEGTLGLALLLVSLFGALLPILAVISPFPLVDTREVRLDGITQVPGAVPAGTMTLRGSNVAELFFPHPDLGQRVLLVLPALVGTLLFLAILEILVRMARTLREGDVFVPQNARRLTAIAVAVLLIGTFAPLLDTITTKLLISGTPLEPKITVGYHLSAEYVLLALLVAATARAFRHGSRLRADTEGLV